MIWPSYVRLLAFQPIDSQDGSGFSTSLTGFDGQQIMLLSMA